MNRGLRPIRADKDNISDFWKLTCATAELLATLVGVEKRYEALLKFTKTLGEVGMKLLEPRLLVQTGLQSDDPASSFRQEPGVLNIEPMLHFLGIDGITLPAQNLLSLLEGRCIETSTFGIHLAQRIWAISARRWHDGKVHLLEDATLSLRVENASTSSIVLSFGSVRLGGEHRERTYIELKSNDGVHSSTEMILVRAHMESQQVRVRLEYWPDCRSVLKSLGVLLTGRARRIPAFRATASELSGVAPTFQCVVVLKEVSNAS